MNILLKKFIVVIIFIDILVMIEFYKFDFLNRKNWDLLKDKSGRWYNVKNYLEEILSLFKFVYINLKEFKLVILVFVKCEIYV